VLFKAEKLTLVSVWSYRKGKQSQSLWQHKWPQRLQCLHFLVLQRRVRPLYIQQLEIPLSALNPERSMNHSPL